MTVAAVEAAFQARFAQLNREHPRAVLAVLREGAMGYDPSQLDKVYAGWKDAYFNSHGPDGNYVELPAITGRKPRTKSSCAIAAR